MKRHKVLALILLALVSFLFSSTTLRATYLPVGGSIGAPPASPVLNVQDIANTGNVYTTFGGTTAIYMQHVFGDAYNPFGAGDTTVLLELAVSPGEANALTVNVPVNIQTDIAYNAGVGIVPDSVTRATNGAVTFHYDAPNDLNSSQFSTSSSIQLLIRTDATAGFFAPGTVSGIDGSAYLPSAPGPYVTPEPSSRTLLSIGVVGLAGYGWRRRRQIA